MKLPQSNQRPWKALRTLKASLKMRHQTLTLMPRTQSLLKLSLNQMRPEAELILRLSRLLSARSQRLAGPQAAVQQRCVTMSYTTSLLSSSASCVCSSGLSELEGRGVST